MARGGNNNTATNPPATNNNHFLPLTPAPDLSSIDGANSPFFLHTGDHPGLSLVSHALTGPNYNTWNRAMLMALNAKNKLCFVDGSIPQPPVTDPLAGIWSCCNNMVTSWLLNAVSKEIADSLLYLDSAHAVWTDLQERFRQSNAPRVFQIKQMRGQILMLEPLPYVAKVFNLVVQEERQCSIVSVSPAPSNSLAFSTVSSQPALLPTPSPPASVAAAWSASSQPKSRRERPVCTHCGLSGHSVDRCYKLHGFPPGYRPKPKP
ncbi:uncharacterized protein LOC112092088 [Morus notabilis]|uniref:uncharacterized protein LOC112092088 n=1 Tax=Morus notabilis TaxID=981085 RepID=UPI000CED554A|nr:uncharacterized protein LOC112092088 [Morus notabilis]